MSTLTGLLAALTTGDVEILDLTAPLSSDTPILQLPPPFANTIPLSMDVVSAFDDDGPMWRWNNLHLGEHTGTHLDAPAHWLSGKDGATVDQIAPRRLIGPAAVLDVTAQVADDPDFTLEPEHLLAWEDENGPIPDGAWVLMRTGWSARSHDSALFLNADENGPHTPGPSAACARWLAQERPITGFGVETVGIDAGQAGTFDPIFPAHNFLLGADKYGITQLQGLDRLPATGAVVIASPLPIVNGTGSPARVLALVPAGSSAA
jgi:kynurenine formamidase